MANNNIHFEKAAIKHKDIVFSWLAEPHMQEFWDNSQEHKDDILNFMHGHKQHYFFGTTRYWVAYLDEQPYAFILSDDILANQKGLSELHKSHLSKSGHTITVDFGIGNPAFIGKGLAVPTLQAFTEYYFKSVDTKADTFFIDPDPKNPRAVHVYEKAGFELVGDFIMEDGWFKEQKSLLMVKRINDARHE